MNKWSEADHCPILLINYYELFFYILKFVDQVSLDSNSYTNSCLLFSFILVYNFFYSIAKLSALNTDFIIHQVYNV